MFLSEIKTISNLNYMVLRRNMQYWSVIWVGVYFIAVTNDLGINKLATVQSIFRLDLWYEVIKSTPEVAALQVGSTPVVTM